MTLLLPEPRAGSRLPHQHSESEWPEEGDMTYLHVIRDT